MTRTLECPCLYLVILIGVSRKLITPGHSFTIAVVSRCSVAFRPPIVFTSDGVPFQRTPGVVLYNMGARMRLRHLDVRRGPKTLFFFFAECCRRTPVYFRSILCGTDASFLRNGVFILYAVDVLSLRVHPAGSRSLRFSPDHRPKKCRVG